MKRSWIRVLVMVMVIGLALSVAACSQKSEPTPQPAPSEPAPQPAPEPSGPPAGWPSKLVVGFVPSSDAAGISDKVKPMSDFLSQRLGIPVEAYVGTDYVNTIEAMGSGQVHVGFLNPLSYVLAYNEHQVEVMLKTVRRGSASYSAQIIVNKDAGIASVDDLKGKKFAFGDPASTSSYLWPTDFIMKHFGLTSKDAVETFFSAITFAGSHDNVVKAVYSGDFDAGSTFDDARTRIQKEFPDVLDKVVVLTKVEGIPNDTISVIKSLPDDLVQALHDAFLVYAASEEGHQVLYDLYQIDWFVDAYPADYQPVVDVANAMGLDVRAMFTPK